MARHDGGVNEQDQTQNPMVDSSDGGDGEITEPLSFGRPPEPSAPSWVPPTMQPPPGQWAGQWSPPGTRFLAAEPSHHVLPRGRVSRWTWPVVALLALVLGVVGGVGGSAAYERYANNDTVAGTVLGGLGAVDTISLPPLSAKDGSVAAVAQELLPSTVQISAEYQGEANGATGSGFVLDRQGHIITNNHVVADAAKDDGPIEIVDQDGNRYEATIVGRSPVYDIAVLYAADAKGLKPASLGASSALRVGEDVVALGSPLGLSSTVTAGIVSALDRPVTTGDSTKDSSYINAVQTDAAINPGNSGGPLVNLLGQVVGVNSAIATTGGTEAESGNIGVGFAIPIEQVKITADQILRTGEASYPVIGATVKTGQRDGSGAEIEEVLKDSPAEASGLESGDVITGIDGERVTDGIALIVAIRTHQPGETVEFTLQRGGDEKTVSVTLGSETG